MSFALIITLIIAGVLINGLAWSIDPQTWTIRLPSFRDKKTTLYTGFLGPIVKALQLAVFIMGFACKIPGLMTDIPPQIQTSFLILGLSAAPVFPLKRWALKLSSNEPEQKT